MVEKIICIVSVCLFLSSCTSEKRESFPKWQEGELEIHHIYTGRGESNFFILPDGTTMLVDAGDYDPKDYPKITKILPDSTKRAGELIARYIKRVNPKDNYVDYLMISHFHSDHIGAADNDVSFTQGRTPDYKLTGIAEVGEYIKFGRLFDRGYPNYQYPVPMEDDDTKNYYSFVAWKTLQKEFVQEEFIVGAKNQIKLLQNEDKYYDIFSVLNLASNGLVWTGKDVLRCYDLNSENLDRSRQNENTKSLAFRIDYGPFSYYAGGDISSFVYNENGDTLNVEALVAKACGPVDICKVNHHAWVDAMTDDFVKNIKAKQYVIPVWEDEHIQPEVITRMLDTDLYPGNRTIFPTCFPIHLREKYSSCDWYNQISSTDGHVIIKVKDKGTQYYIYVLSAEDETNNVKAKFGPFDSEI